MNNDAASLDNLRDIAVPPPVPWWPPAVGWWIVFCVFIVTALAIIWRAWRRWRSSAYRRVALRELRSAKSIVQVAEILKRTALCAYPRINVAALSGNAWCKWLQQTGGKQVPTGVADVLTRGVFDDRVSANVEDVREFAADWIQHHGRSLSRTELKSDQLRTDVQSGPRENASC